MPGGWFRLHHHEVIADRVEAVAVDPLALGCPCGTGAELLIEDAVAEPLAGFDFVSPLCLAEQQVSAGGGYVWQVWQCLMTPGRFLPQTRPI